ncbi:carbonic anhydrase 2-like [Salminus brasiliensis]|uniref:carbonic anhydrase 2-like n=1 Tax=Salminus brasiliensis TaxID=930266 RepID=UPI003B839B98
MESWLVIVLSIQVTVLRASAFKVSTADFCYREDHCDPYAWMETFILCAPDYTKDHSPIDFNAAVMKNHTIPPLRFTGFHTVQDSWTVANVRDTVVVEFDKGMTVSGGWLKYEYRLVEMRFHWGSKTTNGSEHTLNRRRFPMEMQMVGLAPGFADVEAASFSESGLFMMGVFIDIDDTENLPFRLISDTIPSLSYPGDSVNITPPALMDLMPEITSQFYQYSGGQTTPPCLQTVSWIVLENPIFISKDQYLLFTTSLYYSNKNDPERKLLVENYRPIQSSFMRKVFASPDATVPKPSGAAQTQDSFSSLCLVFSLLLVLRCVLKML